MAVSTTWSGKGPQCCQGAERRLHVVRRARPLAATRIVLLRPALVHRVAIVSIECPICTCDLEIAKDIITSTKGAQDVLDRAATLWRACSDNIIELRR